MLKFIRRFLKGPEAGSPTGLTGQPFTVNPVPDDPLMEFHSSRIPELEQSIRDLKDQGRDTSTHEQALAVHRAVLGVPK